MDNGHYNQCSEIYGAAARDSALVPTETKAIMEDEKKETVG